VYPCPATHDAGSQRPAPPCFNSLAFDGLGPTRDAFTRGTPEGMRAGLGQGTRTARRRRIAVLALTGIVLVTAIVVAVALGNVSPQAGPHKDSVVKSLIAELADPSSQQVNSIAFSPDGKTLVTADENGRAYLWDLATRTRIATLTGPPGSQGMISVAFSPNGKTLATANDDGLYLYWFEAARAAVTEPRAAEVESKPVRPHDRGGSCCRTSLFIRTYSDGVPGSLSRCLS
jgi:hypothetical protein